MDDAHTRLRALAAGQDGQFATRQALDLDLPRATLSWLRQKGYIQQRRYGVWRFTAAPGEPDEAITAFLACWPHAVISHESAAQHHRVERVQSPALPVVSVPHGIVLDRRGITIHRTRCLAGDALTIGTLRYTTKARTVCDLADASDPWETLAVLDAFVTRGCNPRWIHRRATALANGRAGVSLVRDATGPDAAGRFNSWLERASGHVYRAAHLPDPEWNVEVRDARGRIGVVDALWLPWRVISEKEGLRFHTSPLQRRKDAERFNRLLEALYSPRRFTWEDVVHRPLWVAETLHRALRAAGADLDPARMPRRIVLPDRPFL